VSSAGGSSSEKPPGKNISISSESPHRESQSRVARSAGVVSIAVMGSRILGLVRELVFAAFFGAGFATDAFIIAFRVPNLLRDLFAEGALSAAFVTTFSQTVARKGDREAWRLANLVNNGLIIVLAIIVILGIIFAPQIVGLLLNPGPEAASSPRAALTFDLAVMMTRIMFPFLLMVSLAAVAMGVLNTKDRFGIPASASTMFNVGSIAVGLFCSYILAPDYIGGIARELLSGAIPHTDPDGAARAVVGMAIGTLAGGVLQWLIQVPSLRDVGYRWQPIVSFTDPGVRQVVRLMAPAIVGAAAVQVNVFVNTSFASSLGEGPVSWLNYAFRLIQFPIGVFGVAISTATLPVASRAAARENLDEFRHTIASSLRLTFLLTIPSAIGLVALNQAIIGLIYERGRFTEFDTIQTGQALAFYALGLTAYSAIKVLAPAFYALNDTRLPMIASVTSIVTNFVIASVAVTRIGHRGLALSVSAVALVNFIILFVFLRRKLGGIEGRSLAVVLLKVVAASVAMGMLAWFTSQTMKDWLGMDTLVIRMINVAVSILLGISVFYLVARLLRVKEIVLMTSALRRRLGV
jgi:putative peptidoglycan lipid II flippase